MNKNLLLISFLLSPFIGSSQITFTESSGILNVDVPFGDGYLGGGVSFCDFNGDGLDDLTYCTSQGMPLRFFQNDGSGFVELIPAPVQDTSHIKQVNWVDIDNDGDKDLYLSANQGISKLYRNDGGLNMVDITTGSGIMADSIEAYGSSWGDIDNDGYLDLYISVRDLTDICRLYHNNGDYTFTDITVSAGVADTADLGFCSVFFDYDNDGDQDLYVSTDKYISQNKLFQNDGTGSFTDVSNSSGAGIWIDAMCTTIGDYNNDGYFDIYITNTFLGNEFLLNNQDGTFTNIAPLNGTEYLGIAWGAQFFDGDNDLDLDIYVSGMNYTSPTQTSVYYENDGLGIYNVPISFGFEGDTMNSFGNAMGDYNNDGFVDLAISNGSNENNFLLKNNANSNNWLKVNLEGRISNYDGIGSKIILNVNGINYYNYTNCGESYLSQNSMDEFFAMGSYTTADSLIVLWPSGHSDTLYDIDANQTISIIEGQTVPINTTINSTNNFICIDDTVNITAGDGSGQCLWSNGETTTSIMAIEGEYWATITNVFGFSMNTDTVLISLSNIDFNFSTSDITCNSNNNGEINLVTIGNDPINILWSGGETTPYLSDLGSGWYYVSAIDSNGCIESDSVYINEPSPLTFIVGSSQESTGGMDGSAWVNVSGGIPPYNYFWNDPSSQTNDSIIGLAGGTYIVWIVDSNGCQDSLHINVGSSLELTAQYNPYKISIYPNPANDYVYIETLGSLIEVNVYTLSGKMILQTDLIDQPIDISVLSDGLYIIQVIDEDGQINNFPLSIK